MRRCAHRRVVAVSDPEDPASAECIDCGSAWAGFPGVERITGWIGELAFHFSAGISEPWAFFPALEIRQRRGLNGH